MRDDSLRLLDEVVSVESLNAVLFLLICILANAIHNFPHSRLLSPIGLVLLRGDFRHVLFYCLIVHPIAPILTDGWVLRLEGVLLVLD
jgi:hypothetical protein